MTRIFGVASDVHLHNWTAFTGKKVNGVNERLDIILTELKGAAKAVVGAGGKRLVITGDLFHVRGSITPSVLNPTQIVFKEIVDSGIDEIVILAGNHDLESKESDSLTNACESLSQIEKVTVVSTPIVCEESKSFYIPWHDSCEDLLETIKHYIKQIGDVSEYDLFIHAPVDDVLPNMPGKGLAPLDLQALGFRFVFSGHYHNHKEPVANVFSVGALTHQTWGDASSKAGFMILVDDEVMHLSTNAPMFVDFDAASVTDEVEALEICQGNYVRIRLDSVTQSEVAEMRTWLVNDLRAKDCIIQATPKSKVVRRASSASTGGSTLVESIADFIDSKTTGVDKKALQRECDDILTIAVSI